MSETWRRRSDQSPVIGFPFAMRAPAVRPKALAQNPLRGFSHPGLTLANELEPM